MSTYQLASPRGASALEILTAIALCGALAGIATARLVDGMSAWRLDAGVRQLVLDLKVARMRAVAESADHRLRLAFPAPAYQGERREAGGAYTAVGPPTALPAGVEIVDCTARGAAVTFRPLGHASTFGTITLENDDGKQRRIVVDIAGRLRVE
jgi:Tfp pilus assembly protein FimT